MKRINRPLSRPPAHNPSRVLLVLTALLVSGVVVGTQLDTERLQVPSVDAESSADSALHPGDYRSITSTGVDKQRVYRAWVDAVGRVTESYEENGQALPIDPTARAWIAEMSRMNVPSPPSPPLPPTPPSIVESSEFKSILRLVAADAKVTARIGQPILVLPDSIDGHINMNDKDGKAILSYDLSGPRGRAKIFVSAVLKHGRWTTTRLDVRPKSL